MELEIFHKTFPVLQVSRSDYTNDKTGIKTVGGVWYYGFDPECLSNAQLLKFIDDISQYWTKLHQHSCIIWSEINETEWTQVEAVAEIFQGISVLLTTQDDFLELLESTWLTDLPTKQKWQYQVMGLDFP